MHLKAGSNIHGYLRRHNIFKLILAYVAVFLIGTICLKLPFIVNPGYQVSWVDAMVQSASSISTTGFATFDYINGYNYLGWLIIIILVNIGGVGVIVFNAVILIMIGTRFNIRRINEIQLDYNQDGLINIRTIVKNVVKYFVIIEIVGALIFFLRMGDIFPNPLERIMNAFMLSSSSIGSAGFYNATLIADDYIMIWTCDLLMIYSFIGYPVILEARDYVHSKMQGRPYHFSTFCKISVYVNFITVIMFAVIFYFLESSNAMAGFNIFDKLNYSLFTSLSTKSVGLSLFTDVNLLLPITLFIQTFFMLIGAAPSSAGGGFKTNATYIFFAYLKALFQGKDEVVINKRKVPARTLKLSMVTILLFTMIAIFVTILIVIINPFVDVSQSWFEVVSGFTTTGFSNGVLNNVNWVSQVMFACLMLLGRIGIINVLFLLKQNNTNDAHLVEYPEENISI